MDYGNKVLKIKSINWLTKGNRERQDEFFKFFKQISINE